MVAFQMTERKSLPALNFYQMETHFLLIYVTKIG